MQKMWSSAAATHLNNSISKTSVSAEATNWKDQSIDFGTVDYEEKEDYTKLTGLGTENMLPGNAM
jgi:hypothetical protein